TRARHQTGNVGDHEALAEAVAYVADRYDTEVGLERRERIACHLGPRATDRADQRTLAHVRKAEQANVGHHLELEPKAEPLAGRAGLRRAWRALDRAREMPVAAPTFAATRNYQALAGFGNFAEGHVRFGFEHHGAERYAKHVVLAAAPVAVLALARLAGL